MENLSNTKPEEFEDIALAPKIINPLKDSVECLIAELNHYPIALDFRQKHIAVSMIKQAYNNALIDALKIMKEESRVIYSPAITKIENLMKDRS